MAANSLESPPTASKTSVANRAALRAPTLTFARFAFTIFGIAFLRGYAAERRFYRMGVTVCSVCAGYLGFLSVCTTGRNASSCSSVKSAISTTNELNAAE